MFWAWICVCVAVRILFIHFSQSKCKWSYKSEKTAHSETSILLPCLTVYSHIRDSKIHDFASYFFFLLIIIIRSVCLADIRRSVCTSEFQRSLCVSFSRTDTGLCIYHLFVWSNFNFLHNYQWTTLLIQLFLVLYSVLVRCIHLLYTLVIF